MFRLGNGEIYHDDQEQEYKDDVKSKRCVVCKFKRINDMHELRLPCSNCNVDKKNEFIPSKIKDDEKRNYLWKIVF